jgi:hypothetical protein
LFTIARADDPRKLKAFLRHGLNLKADIYRGEESFLGFVGGWGKMRLVKFLVEELEANKEDLDFIRKSRYRAIDKALLGGHPDIVQLLLTSGANTSRSGALLGQALLSFAAHDRRKVMALLLIRHGVIESDIRAGGRELE